MARSGTSLAASIFANKEYYVASSKNTELQTADRYNPSGYWEANSLLSLNKDILKAVGFKHDNTWFYDPISEQQTADIHELTPDQEHKDFVSNYDKNSPWLWKDPRLCYTLAYWWPLLNKETTAVLLVTREHKEIINSFKRIADDWQTTIPMDDNHIENRIQQHIASAMAILKKYDIPYIEIDYADYNQRPAETAEKLSQYFNVQLTKDDLGYKNKANHSSLQGRVIHLVNRIYLDAKKLLKF